MKVCNSRILLFLLFVLPFTLVNAQQSIKLYYNNRWELTFADSAVYYRLARIDTLEYGFIDEAKDFNKQDQLLMQGIYKNGKKNGTFTFYYPSGQIESQGAFKDNFRIGTWKYFYPNGKPLQEVRMDDGDFSVISAFDEGGNQVVKDGTGEWKHSYEWIDVPERITIQGNFVDGKKDGTWVCGLANGTILYKEIFKNGVFKRGFYTKENGSYQDPYSVELKNKFLPHYKHALIEEYVIEKGVTRRDYPMLKFLPKPYNPYDTTKSGEKIYLVVENPPEYVGGQEALNQFVYKRIKYPALARKNKAEGTVFVGFIIEADGSVSNVTVIKGVSRELDEEAVRVVSLFPVWKPGTLQGKPVRVKFVYPIKFSLD